MNPQFSKLQTVKKMSLIPIVATVAASLTYKYVQNYVSAEIYAGGLISILIAAKDILKFKFKLF